MKKVLLFATVCLVSIVSFAGSNNSKANDLYNKGKEKLKTLSRLEAKKLFSEAIDLDPNFVEAYYERALIFKHFKDIDAALVDFEKVTSRESKLRIPAHLEIGKIKIDKEEFDASIKHFDEIIAVDSKNTDALLLRGQSKIKTEKFQESLKDFEAILALDENNNEALFFTGLVKSEMNAFKDAIVIFDQVIEKNKRNADAYFYRAYCHYELVIEAHDKHKRDHLLKSEADYTKAIALDPKLEEAYFDRGEVRMALKHYVDAIADFKSAIEIKPNDLEAHYQKAMCNYHYGYEEKAFEEFKSIIEMDSTYANAHFMIGTYLYETQEFDAAETEFTKLMTLESEHADAHYWRGLSRIELGIFEGACEDLRRSEEMGMHVEKTVYHAARCTD